MRVPAPIVGLPMTYMLNGRQYIVVGVSGGNYTGEYIAFALPQSEIRTHDHRRSAVIATGRRLSQFKGTGRQRPVLFFFVLHFSAAA